MAVPPSPVRNLRRAEVIERFGLSPSGLWKLVKHDRFPRPFYIAGLPLWRLGDIEAVESGLWKPPAPAFDPLADDEPEKPDPPKRPRGRSPGSCKPKAAATPAYAFGSAIGAHA